ncbi:MAG TPA: PH domain-containing protein [Syntrophomonadaceae bacterium]|nr:PH domain-containing protein [Syntrophomonadaceae bacterium]
MEYRAKKSYAAWLGLFFGAAIFSFLFWGVQYSLGPHDLALKVMLYIPIYLVLAGFLYMLIGAFNIGYKIEEKNLIIYWGLTTMRIPWESIEQVIQVKGESNMYSIFGASWPGYMAGLYQAKGLGTVRMYGTQIHKGFIYVKSSNGFFGLTPADDNMIQEIASRSSKEIEIVDMDKIPEEIKGKSAFRDGFYRMLLWVNIAFLALYAGYLAVCFPGSGAQPFVVLLLVLAVCLFFFTLGNANRLYHFSPIGGYFLLCLGILVTGIFLILSLSEITLK